MKNLFFLLIVVTIFITSCNDSIMGDLGGTQSSAGEVGNTFTTNLNVSGISGISAEVTDLKDGVSTMEYSVDITNPSILQMIKSFEGSNVSGSTVSGELKYRFSSNGIESVYDDGALTLVKYDAKVGDVYTAKHNGATIRREVTEVAKEDEYYWYGWLLKTIEVTETGRAIPGVKEIRYRYNHKFTIVGTKVIFEDGTYSATGIYSSHSADVNMD